MTVTADRPSYAIGDTIIITISIGTTDQDSTVPLVIQVIDPENTVVATKVLETNEDGKYTAELPTAGFEISGTYVIHVTSADDDLESTFENVENLDSSRNRGSDDWWEFTDSRISISIDCRSDWAWIHSNIFYS